MSKILAVLTVLVLISLPMVSCDNRPKIGKDGYRFDEKEYEIVDNSIEFVIIPNEKEFVELRNQYVGANSDVAAFSRLRKQEKRCIVYIRDPYWSYEPEYIGHEIAHCIWGRWHRDNLPDKGTE